MTVPGGAISKIWHRCKSTPGYRHLPICQDAPESAGPDFNTRAICGRPIGGSRAVSQSVVPQTADIYRGIFKVYGGLRGRRPATAKSRTSMSVSLVASTAHALPLLSQRAEVSW